MITENEFCQPVGSLINAWKHAFRPSNKTLQGQHCTLESISITKHANALFKNLATNNQGASWTYLPYGPFESLDEFSMWLAETQSEQDTELYAILNSKNEPVGISGYLRINPSHGVIEVGHLHFSTLLQKSIAATEAMYLMMQYAFDELGYRRYEWKCNSLNAASKNAALRLGFTFEGVFRQSNIFKNRNRDTAWFSIIDAEWPTLKMAFTRWLLPSNFDSHGKQIMSLQKIIATLRL